jgi:hypothetical protein
MQGDRSKRQAAVSWGTQRGVEASSEAGQTQTGYGWQDRPVGTAVYSLALMSDEPTRQVQHAAQLPTLLGARLAAAARSPRCLRCLWDTVPRADGRVDPPFKDTICSRQSGRQQRQAAAANKWMCQQCQKGPRCRSASACHSAAMCHAGCCTPATAMHLELESCRSPERTALLVLMPCSCRYCVRGSSASCSAERARRHQQAGAGVRGGSAS